MKTTTRKGIAKIGLSVLFILIVPAGLFTTTLSAQPQTAVTTTGTGTSTSTTSETTTTTSTTTGHSCNNIVCCLLHPDYQGCKRDGDGDTTTTTTVTVTTTADTGIPQFNAVQLPNGTYVYCQTPQQVQGLWNKYGGSLFVQGMTQFMAAYNENALKNHQPLLTGTCIGVYRPSK